MVDLSKLSINNMWLEDDDLIIVTDDGKILVDETYVEVNLGQNNEDKRRVDKRSTSDRK